LHITTNRSPLPLAFLPLPLFYKKWRQSNVTNPSPRGELEPIISTYAIAGTLGLPIVGLGLVQFGIYKAFTTILFRSPQTRKDFLREFFRGSVEGLTTSEL
jgi:hypothetical protein